MSHRVDGQPELRVIPGGEARIGQGPSAQPVVVDEGDSSPKVPEGRDHIILEPQPELPKQSVHFQSILAKSSWSEQHASRLAGEVLARFADVLTGRADREEA